MTVAETREMTDAEREEDLREWARRVFLGEAALIVKPGETLVIRTADLTPQQIEEYQEYADRYTADLEAPFRVLIVHGDELAVAKGQPFAVVEIEWTDGGETRREKFGPWLTAPDDSHLVVISGFINGWSSAKGVEPKQVTLIVGDKSITEGATYPYRG